MSDIPALHSTPINLNDYVVTFPPIHLDTAPSFIPWLTPDANGNVASRMQIVGTPAMPPVGGVSQPHAYWQKIMVGADQPTPAYVDWGVAVYSTQKVSGKNADMSGLTVLGLYSGGTGDYTANHHRMVIDGDGLGCGYTDWDMVVMSANVLTAGGCTVREMNIVNESSIGSSHFSKLVNAMGMLNIISEGPGKDSSNLGLAFGIQYGRNVYSATNKGSPFWTIHWLKPDWCMPRDAVNNLGEYEHLEGSVWTGPTAPNGRTYIGNWYSGIDFSGSSIQGAPFIFAGADGKSGQIDYCPDTVQPAVYWVRVIAGGKHFSLPLMEGVW